MRFLTIFDISKTLKVSKVLALLHHMCRDHPSLIGIPVETIGSIDSLNTVQSFDWDTIVLMGVTMEDLENNAPLVYLHVKSHKNVVDFQ